MNVFDEMSEAEVLRAASDALSRMPMASPPDMEAIMARARSRRRHLVSAAAAVSLAAAAGTTLALGLTGAPGSAHVPGAIGTASFTLVSNADGTATLTINPRELLEPGALQSDLQQYGIPAVVTSGSICTSDPAPAGFSQVVSASPAGPQTSTPQPVANPTITIDPSAMPAGTELSVGYFRFSSGTYAGEQLADVLLIDTDSHSCSSTPPDPNGLPGGYGPDDGLGLLYGGPGQAGS